MKRAAVAAVFLSALLMSGGSGVRADFVCSSTVQNVCSGGGGGASGITSGTTTITGGTDTHVCYNDAGVMRCGDAGFTYLEGSDTPVILGNLELGHATQNTIACSGGACTIEGASVATGTAANIFTARNTFGSAADAANAVDINETAGCITFEGSGADGIEGRLCISNPSGSDSTYNLPNAAASVILASISQAQSYTGIQTFSSGFAGPAAVEAVTVSKTTTLLESQETYTNTGDTDGATITLLNDPTVGAVWHVAVTVAQTITIAPSAGESLYMGTDQCNTSMTANAIGATVTIRAVSGGSGGVYMAFGASGWTCVD